MRRVMVAAWGVEASTYTGHRMTLYRDPTIRFGGMEVGGIRISHLSHIDKRLTLALTVTRGKRAPCVVDPLTESGPTKPKAAAIVEPSAEQVAACTDTDALRAMWQASGAERQAQIEARVAELNAGDPS